MVMLGAHRCSISSLFRQDLSLRRRQPHRHRPGLHLLAVQLPWLVEPAAGSHLHLVGGLCFVASWLPSLESASIR